MANKSNTDRQKPNRRAPASIQITPPVSSDWNVAIPLLTPLPPVQNTNRITTISSSNTRQESPESEKQATTEYKKWQHPADPFYYEPAPPFICTCTAAQDM
ncbi:hypothetical protein OSB04_029610 [Centaurea solstitialis]|uniref:Uncharacterized protein n=1 Tax=Centaurea solstitialis TaxID=347529 RepID=A0AA38SPI5_9ASTR|nr:hypothetical protein OSB04_029610 [Centaurea solstitialis]